MKFAVFTSVEHVKKHGHYYGYGPFIREMNLWGKYVDEMVVVAPLSKSNDILPMDLHYVHNNINFIVIPSFNLTSPINFLKALFNVPIILWRIAKVMRQVDHAHLRCPSNVGLLGCFVQICFPRTKKSTKYAGNWDPESSQPLSYRIQKKLLANTVLTKNIKVLVYGEWPSQTRNIVPFISASYTNDEIEPMTTRNYSNRLNFVFVGSIVVGKRPIFTIKVIEELNKLGYPCYLDMFGDGEMLEEVKNYVNRHDLNDLVAIHGNQEKDVIKGYLKKAHFNILPSKSEGWPKAIAEGMFFGAISISTKISCLEWMLDNGNRGILIEPDLESAATEIVHSLKNKNLDEMAQAGQKWSQQYTLNTLESAIKEILYV